MAIRLPFALQFGLLVMLCIFWMLWRLVDAPILAIATPINPAPYDPVVVDPPKPPPGTTWNKPPPPVLLPPVTYRGPGPTVVVIENPPIVAPPGPTYGGGDFVRDTPVAPTDRDPIPVVRIQPDYPISAEQREIEGWVIVEFNITRAGAVSDARVVAAKPARIFDSNTLKAVARWRYNPRVVDGEAAETVGVQSKIVFSLEDGRR
jgi:protein TonB